MTSPDDSKTTTQFSDARFKYSQGIGIALGGGLARGFAHIGVLKTLNKHGIYPSIVAGTSIGALVGGAYLTGNMDNLEDWALSLNRFKIFSYLDFRVRSAGLIGGNKLESIMMQHFGDIKIEDLPHPFIAISADLLTGHEVWMRKGNLIEAMKASFALPGVFPPVKRNNRNLVDGALVNPVPVSVCQALGARLTLAVDLHADLIGKAAKPGQNYQTVAGFDVFNEDHVPLTEQKKLFSGSFAKRLFRREEDAPSLFGVMVSALGILQDRITRSRLAGDPPDIHIKPSIGHIGMLEFERAKELIELGEEAAERALPDIQAAMQVLLTPEHRPDQDISDIPDQVL
ncbi:MAG TPA: patatin-like phospholipase family protein [Alphaproteobacteria bacterium]|nr:patatin-like phospholipase family protein [Alphaproteobacteria bacterium]